MPKFNININKDYLSFIGFQEKLLFTRHLSILLKSGVPILEAISTLQEQTTNKAFKRILNDIVTNISNGKSLSSALAEHEHIFGSLYVSIVKIGEESGNLEDNLTKLADSMQKFYEFKQRVVASSIYPIIILITGLSIVTFISLFIFPKILELFTSFEGELPWTTKVLINIINFTKNYGVYTLIGIVLFFITLVILLRFKRFKYLFDVFVLNIPVLGNFLRSVILTDIFLNLGMMLKSGVPINKAFDYQIQGVNNLVYKDILIKLENSLTSGKNLTKEFSDKKYSYIPIIAQKMIVVGEKSGKLPDSLTYLGNFFDEEVEYFTKSLISVIEPLLLLVMGVMVGFVAVAIITPIYQLSSGASIK